MAAVVATTSSAIGFRKHTSTHRDTKTASISSDDHTPQSKDVPTLDLQMETRSKTRLEKSTGTIRCEKCYTSGHSGCTSCIPIDGNSRKRKYEGKGRDSEDIKRRSIPSPAASPPVLSSVLSPATSNDFDETMAFNTSGDSSSEEHAIYIGPTTELESSLFSILDMSHLARESMAFIQRGSSVFSLDRGLTGRSQLSRTHATRKIMASVGTLGPSLVNAYEKHIHHTFPIVADEFLVNARQGIVEKLEPTLLAAIYAVSMPWIESQDEASISNQDNIAFGLFTKTLHAPSIHIIQAGLLLMQRSEVDSKVLNSQLVGAAYEIGLHLDCTSWNTLTESDKKLHKRLAWALYTQDTWCSLIHGRPTWIDRNNWAVKELEETDLTTCDTTSEEQTNGHMMFIQLVNLTKILASVLESFFTLKAQQEIEHRGQTGTRLILERAKPVQLRLKNWFSGLPSVLKMDSNTSETPTTIGILHLAYFATEITLHRCIIRSLQMYNTDTYLEHICRSAAKTRLISAMDFVNRLRADQLATFWYFPAPVSFALIASFGSLLLATSPSREEQEFYQTRLNEYRWTVGVSSRSAPFLTLAIDTLDQGELLLRNVPTKPPSAELAVVLPQLVTMQSGFAGEVAIPVAGVGGVASATGRREEFNSDVDDDDNGEDSDDSGSTRGDEMELVSPQQQQQQQQQQLHHSTTTTTTTSGLMSPSTSTEDGYGYGYGFQ